MQLVNTGTNAARAEETDTDGRYQFNNVDVGNYRLKIEAAGFQSTNYQPFDLAARDTQRIDIDLKVASQATSVTVEAVATIQTEVSPQLRQVRVARCLINPLGAKAAAARPKSRKVGLHIRAGQRNSLIKGYAGPRVVEIPRQRAEDVVPAG